MSRGRDIYTCTRGRAQVMGQWVVAGIWLHARPQDLCEFVGAMSWKKAHIRSQRAMPLCLEFTLKIVGATVGLTEGDIMISLMS